MRIIYNYLIVFLFSFLISTNSLLYYDRPTNEDDYNFTLKIPKIDLIRDVYVKESENNNVNKGIYLANEYTFSNENNIVILASHSGNSSISYFKHLNLLHIGDYVYTQNDEYQNIYKISKIYEIKKTGKFKYSKKDKGIYLITCDKSDNAKQIVLFGKMEKYIKKSSFL